MSAEQSGWRTLLPVRPRVGSDRAAESANHPRAKCRHRLLIAIGAYIHNRIVIAVESAATDPESAHAALAHVAECHWLKHDSLLTRRRIKHRVQGDYMEFELKGALKKYNRMRSIRQFVMIPVIAAAWGVPWLCGFSKTDMLICLVGALVFLLILGVEIRLKTLSP